MHVSLTQPAPLGGERPGCHASGTAPLRLVLIKHHSTQMLAAVNHRAIHPKSTVIPECVETWGHRFLVTSNPNLTESTIIAQH